MSSSIAASYSLSSTTGRGSNKVSAFASGHTWYPIVAAASSEGGRAATTAWIAAGAALVVGAATVAANLWIARGQRRDAARQPTLEQGVTLAQERDGRIRAAVEAVETIRIHCWEISSACRGRDGRAVADVATRLGIQTDRLTADTLRLHESWVLLRPDLSEGEHDRLLSARILCLEALDALVTAIAVGLRMSPPSTEAVRESVEALDGLANTLVDDLLALRRAWATASRA